MAKDALPGVDSDTQSMIEDQVKKGKARKFFLVYRGATMKKLEVFKKGPFGPRVTKARKEGYKGDVLQGVISGSGKELTFHLAGNDDVAAVMKVDSCVEKPPTEEAKLRKFLTDNGLNFKPSYQIISDPALAPNASEEDDDAPAPQAAITEPPASLAPVAPEAPASVEEAPKAPPSPVEAAPAPTAAAEPPKAAPQAPAVEQEPTRESLEQRFAALQPRLSVATAAHPDEAEDLEDLANEFSESLSANDLQVAGEWLEKLADALDELPDVDPRQTQFEGRLKELLPVAVPLAKAGGEHGAALMTLLKKVQAQRSERDYAGGLETIAQIEEALTRAQGSPVPAAPTSPPPAAAAQDSQRQQFEALLKQHAAAGVAAAKAGGANAAELAGMLKQIQADRNASAFAAGIEKLQRVAELLAGDGQDTSGPLTEWRQRRDALEPRLLEAQRANPDQAARLLGAWEFAGKQADAGAFDKAFDALERLTLAIDKVLATAPTSDTERLGIPEGIVAQVKQALSEAKARWTVALRDAKAELKKVQDGIKGVDPVLAAALDSVVLTYESDLMRLLEEAEKTQDSQSAGDAQRDVLAKAGELKAAILRDDVIEYLDTYENANVGLQHAFMSGLEEVEQRLVKASA